MAFNLTIWYIMQTGKTALTFNFSKGAAGYEIHFIPFASLCVLYTGFVFDVHGGHAFWTIDL